MISCKILRQLKVFLCVQGRLILFLVNNIYNAQIFSIGFKIFHFSFTNNSNVYSKIRKLLKEKRDKPFKMYIIHLFTTEN